MEYVRVNKQQLIMELARYFFAYQETEDKGLVNYDQAEVRRLSFGQIDTAKQKLILKVPPDLRLREETAFVAKQLINGAQDKAETFLRLLSKDESNFARMFEFTLDGVFHYLVDEFVTMREELEKQWPEELFGKEALEEMKKDWVIYSDEEEEDEPMTTQQILKAMGDFEIDVPDSIMEMFNTKRDSNS